MSFDFDVASIGGFGGMEAPFGDGAAAAAAASSFLQHVESFDANAAVAASQLQLLAPDDPRQPRTLLTENFMLKYFKVRTERRAER